MGGATKPKDRYVPGIHLSVVEPFQLFEREILGSTHGAIAFGVGTSGFVLALVKSLYANSTFLPFRMGICTLFHYMFEVFNLYILY